jgi:hypothetical protein
MHNARSRMEGVVRSYNGIISVVVSIVLLLISAATHAAINPAEYMKNATEKLTVEITGSSTSDTIRGGKKTLTRVYLVARVLGVNESKTGLKPGDAIMIKYKRNHARYEWEQRAMKKKAKKGWVGPQILYAPDVPHIGQKRVVYLKSCEDCEGFVFSPAAHQYSIAQPPL